MKIDCHNHIGERPGASQSIEELIDRMDDSHIDKSIIFSFPEVIQNDLIVSAVREFPDRFVGFTCINPWIPEASIELKKYSDLGLKGLKLHPLRHGYGMEKHEILDPLFSICEEYQLHVIVHCTSDNPFTSPFQIEEAAKTFPKVTFQMAHMATMWGTGQAIMVAGRNENIYLESSGVSPFAIRDAAKKVGSEKILMGTDTPWYSMKQELEKINFALENNEVDIKNVTYKNIVGIIDF